MVAFLTTAAPTWNNWARNPGVVMFLDLQAYLCGRDEAAPSRLVGSPLEVTLDPAKYLPQVRFVTPQEAGPAAATIDAVAGPDKMLHAVLAETDVSGYYEALLTRSDNERRRDPPLCLQRRTGRRRSGRARSDATGRTAEGLNYQFEQAAAFQTAQNESTGDNLREAILVRLDCFC